MIDIKKLFVEVSYKKSHFFEYLTRFTSVIPKLEVVKIMTLFLLCTFMNVLNIDPKIKPF